MQSGNEIWQVYAILQNNFFYQKILEKMWTGNKSFLIFKKSSVKKILRKSACWFGQILIDLLLQI